MVTSHIRTEFGMFLTQAIRVNTDIRVRSNIIKAYSMQALSGERECQTHRT